MQLDWQNLFLEMHPGFFERPYIAGLPESKIYEEMALPLARFSPDALSIPVPEGISFGFYQGDRTRLLQAVREVDGPWVALFTPETRVYCAMAGDEIASFCMMENMGVHQGVSFAGPGCVGTVPAFRRQGIGLKMIQRATSILKDEGYDISYIHYTGVAPWYARLGYETVLHWNKNGFLPAAPNRA